MNLHIAEFRLFFLPRDAAVLQVNTLDKMRLIDRVQEIPHEVHTVGRQHRLLVDSARCLVCRLSLSCLPSLCLVRPLSVLFAVSQLHHQGAFCDLVWSDPEEIDAWQISPRGAGWLFGAKVVNEFNHLNKLELICRAHQLVQEG